MTFLLCALEHDPVSPARRLTCGPVAGAQNTLSGRCTDRLALTSRPSWLRRSMLARVRQPEDHLQHRLRNCLGIPKWGSLRLRGAPGVWMDRASRRGLWRMRFALIDELPPICVLARAVQTLWHCVRIFRRMGAHRMS